MRSGYFSCFVLCLFVLHVACLRLFHVLRVGPKWLHGPKETLTLAQIQLSVHIYIYVVLFVLWAHSDGRADRRIGVSSGRALQTAVSSRISFCYAWFYILYLVVVSGQVLSCCRFCVVFCCVTRP